MFFVFFFFRKIIKKLWIISSIFAFLKEEINAVRRELAHMEKAGMVAKEQRANRLYYSFRKDYPLYYDLLELIAKTTGLGAAILRQARPPSR